MAQHGGRTVLFPGCVIPPQTRATAPLSPPEQNLRQNPAESSATGHSPAGYHRDTLTREEWHHQASTIEQKP